MLSFHDSICYYSYFRSMRCLLVLFVLISSFCYSQSLTGTNGLFKVPSAFIGDDGFSYIGVSIYPKGYYEYLDVGNSFTGMPTFITLSLFDRVEFMFRYTHQLGHEVSPQTQYFPDRMFTLRYNLLRESSKFPSITLGLHDVSEALGGTSATPWFLATYLVASKTIETSKLTIAPTIGYAYDIIDSSRPQIFNGLFAGVELTASQLPYLTVVGEYDSEMFNVALKTTVLGHLHFAVGLLDMQALTGFFTYRFNLSNR
jgi:hypothetical protein